MMKVSRKIWRSSQKSTSIYRRKKKKSNEKNNLGKSGKRSRGHRSDGEWVRDMGESPHLRNVLFIEPW